VKPITWGDTHIEVEPAKKPKKISGTHFATVLNADPWKTPFEAWCKCTRTYETPFEGNKYTNAGEIIEPKVFSFLRTSMGFGNRVVTPTDMYGEDYFKKTRGDFFPESNVFSGMWDALIMGEDGKPEYVVEVKTVKVDGRNGGLEERWKNGQAPHYQALQASLYAYLLGVQKVLMVGVTLKESEGDYDHPEQVTPSYANGNVYIDEFKVLERYENFPIYVEMAVEWWNKYVLTGISPDFDDKKDSEILKVLRTNSLSPDADIQSLLTEAEMLKADIEEHLSKISDKESRLKVIQDMLKEHFTSQFRDGDTKVSVKGNNYEWVLSKTESTEIDKSRLEADGLIEKYSKQKTSYRLTSSRIKED
jgi:hypothetical protein